ncbi:co-chaperone YbbN [uncultured Brevibacillus sp.]|uniref:thioredoxin family protein n=1 Tax=uncultured Brevibacillus sp. TaxID=169970 RepID=UPI0025932A39|nr:thioredoxin family protein [uncultured Brevibacillus sp.]
MGIKQAWLWIILVGVFLLTGVTAWSASSTPELKIVYVYSESCGYCTSFGPTFEKVMQDYPREMIDRLDINKKQELDEALSLGAEATPTIFIVEKGQVKDKLEGDVPEKTLRDFLQRNTNESLFKNG